MKKVLLLFLLAPFALFSQSYDAFLGDSYTFYNNMSAMVSSIGNLVVQEEVRTFKLFKNDR